MDLWSSAVTQALEAVRPYVVHVTSTNAAESSVAFGSGLVIDHYHVAANTQIANNGGELTVETGDGKKFKAEIVGTDPLYFIAILKTEGRLQAGPPPLLPADQLQTGQVVIAVGNPFGIDHTCSLGVISAADRTIYRPERFPVDGLILTDAAIHPGNTGGALARLDGKIVGLNGISWMHGLSLAVQADVVARIAHQIIDYGRATHPWLGFSGEPELIDKTWVELLGLPMDRGVFVNYVAESGPGKKAGVLEGDLVIRADGKPVSNLGAIRKLLSLHREGDRVPLTVFRGGELVEISMPVEEMPRLHERTEES